MWGGGGWGGGGGGTAEVLQLVECLITSCAEGRVF